MDLCESCHEAARLLFPLTKDVPSHMTLETYLPQLDNDIYNNCWMCYRLAQRLRSNKDDKLDIWSQRPLAVTYKYLGLATARFPWRPKKVFSYIVHMYPEHGIDDETIGGEAFELTVLDRTTYKVMLAASKPNISPHIDFALVENWVDMCSKHEACREAPDPWLPLRLLEVTNNGTRAKLILTQTRPSTPTPTGQHRQPYITVSHRWAPVPYKGLFASNIRDLQRGIDVTTLPQAFQDAFAVANRLRISLVWIDSLCIMQDNGSQDLIDQCQLMHKIYANAFLNISATGCEDNYGSLLQRGSCTVFPRPQELKAKGLLAPRTKYVVEGNLWIDEIVQAPLNFRGWVFQERHLARRVLHFGTNQLAWECRQLDALETCPTGLPPKLALNTFPKEELFQQLRDVRSAEVADSKDVYQTWRRLVQEYSACNLTHSEDKLLALKGLAESFNETLVDEYAAGGWKKSLAIDLAWHCDTVTGQIHRANRAPSWSWASIDGSVIFPHNHVSVLRDTYVTNLKFGDLVDSVACDAAPEDRRSVLLTGYLCDLTCQWDDQKIVSFSLNERSSHPVFKGTPCTQIHVTMPPKDFQAYKDLKFLPLFSSRCSIYGLVLTRLEGPGEAYRRLGCVEIALLFPFDEINGKKVIDKLPGDWFEYQSPKRWMKMRKSSKPILYNRTAVKLLVDVSASHDQSFEITIH